MWKLLQFVRQSKVAISNENIKLSYSEYADSIRQCDALISNGFLQVENCGRSQKAFDEAKVLHRMDNGGSMKYECYESHSTEQNLHVE